MRKESTTIQKCNSRLTALGLNSDAAFHRSKLILKIYRDVVWVLSERAEELQETAWIMGEQDIESGLCYLENFAPDIELQAFEEKVCCLVQNQMLVNIKMVADVYSHIIDEDRCINAQRLEEAFYSSKTPDPVEDTEPKTADTAVTESDESDAAKILELLKNPETAALLKQLAKAL